MTLTLPGFRVSDDPEEQGTSEQCDAGEKGPELPFGADAEETRDGIADAASEIDCDVAQIG